MGTVGCLKTTGRLVHGRPSTRMCDVRTGRRLRAAAVRAVGPTSPSPGPDCPSSGSPTARPSWRTGRAAGSSFDEPAVGDDDFPAVGEAFAARAGLCRTGSEGGARAVPLPRRPLVDHAARWFGATRSRTA
ncbi:hypothetical protein [Streptomyces sp. bgisy154]|uniref:hypothetical protein n=1 Tax=Streptomyces sp. bgisy154 TaxID=3413794 RepID=UPI003D75E3D6